MKTKNSLLRLLLCAVCVCTLCAAIAAFAGCFFNKQETYELVSAELTEGGSNNDYTFLKSEKEQYNTSDGRLSFDFTLKLKGSSGNEYQDEITIYPEDDEDREIYFYMHEKPSVPLSLEITGFDDSTLGSKQLTVKFIGNTEFVKSGECETKLDYEVVHIVKNIALHGSTTLEKQYERNEQFDPSSVQLDLTYGDDTTETVGLNVASAMKQLKGTGVEGFDSSTCGFGKRMKLTLKRTNGSSTQTLIYNVKPSSEWTQEEARGYGQGVFYYYKTADMTASTRMVKYVNTLQIAFGSVKINLVQGNGYLTGTVTASAIQSQMNTVASGNNVNLFNLFVPNKNAQVTALSKPTDSSIKAEYDLLEDGSAVSHNVLYDVYSVTGRTQILITVENIDKATEAEKQLVEDFVSCVWFS